MIFKVVRLLQAFSHAIFRTVVEQLFLFTVRTLNVCFNVAVC